MDIVKVGSYFGRTIKCICGAVYLSLIIALSNFERSQI